MKEAIVPLSRLALRLSAEQGMRSLKERVGLFTCPPEYWQTMAAQPSSFVTGYATCLKDVLDLLQNKGPLSSNHNARSAKINLQTLLSIMKVMLFLCDYTLSQRETKRIQA